MAFAANASTPKSPLLADGHFDGRRSEALRHRMGPFPRTARRRLPAHPEHWPHRRTLAHPHQDRVRWPSSSSMSPKAWLEMNPRDAKRLGIKAHDGISVVSRRSRVDGIELRVTEIIAPGQVFMPFHFAETNVNASRRAPSTQSRENRITNSAPSESNGPRIPESRRPDHHVYNSQNRSLPPPCRPSGRLTSAASTPVTRPKRPTSSSASSRSPIAPHRHRARKGLLQEVRNQLRHLEGSPLGRHPRQADPGENQATHMLIGMPFASTWGCSVRQRSRWSFRGCSTATARPSRSPTSSKARSRRAKDAEAVRRQSQNTGDPLTFAMTFPPGTHAMWMRYYLAAGGIHPDKDVTLITIPPPQMVANMKVGKMDGFCVGEPWNARAIADGIGFTVITTQEIWKDHPEKVCAFTEEFAEKNPKTVKAVLKALHEAERRGSTTWRIVPSVPKSSARPTYINCPKEIILGRLQGKYDYGDGRKKQDPNYMIFSNRNCNYPQRSTATGGSPSSAAGAWSKARPTTRASSKQVMRPDLYEEAMKEIGVTRHDRRHAAPVTLVDGNLRPAKSPKHTPRSFPVQQHRLGAGESMKKTAFKLLSCCRSSALPSSCSGLWAVISATVSPDLPSPIKTWEESKPLRHRALGKSAAKWIRASSASPAYSLVRVAKGLLLALLIGTPLGLPARHSRRSSPGCSIPSSRSSGPSRRWRGCRSGLILFRQVRTGGALHHRALLDVADGAQYRCGVRAIPQDYLNVARVLRLSPWKTLHQGAAPGDAALHVHRLPPEPRHRLAGHRRRGDADRHPGVGGFLWQEYNSLIYAHIILCIITIGLVGFILDRLMGLAEAQLQGGLKGLTWLSSNSKQSAKSFGSRNVLQDINLCIEEGEFVSIVGTSGSAARQRCVKMAAGLAKPDIRQRVTVDGQPVSGFPRSAAIVFQNYSLLPWFSALENVRLAVRSGLPGLDRARQQSEQAMKYLEMVGLRQSRSQDDPASSPAACAARGHRPRLRRRNPASSSSTNPSARSTPSPAPRCSRNSPSFAARSAVPSYCADDHQLLSTRRFCCPIGSMALGRGPGATLSPGCHRRARPASLRRPQLMHDAEAVSLRDRLAEFLTSGAHRADAWSFTLGGSMTNERPLEISSLSKSLPGAIKPSSRTSTSASSPVNSSRSSATPAAASPPCSPSSPACKQPPSAASSSTASKSTEPGLERALVLPVALPTALDDGLRKRVPRRLARPTPG